MYLHSVALLLGTAIALWHCSELLALTKHATAFFERFRLLFEVLASLTSLYIKGHSYFSIPDVEPHCDILSEGKDVHFKVT